MEEKQIKFYWKESDDIFIGRNIVCSDNSIIFEPSVDVGAFGLYLFKWIIEIPTGTIGKNNFRYLGGYFFDDRVKKQKLTIPAAKKGQIYFNANFPLMHGFYYNDYVPFKQQMYFDQLTNWFAVGDLTRKGSAIEFASNNIAIINDNKDLVAVYAKLFF